jgi:L-ribulose-5-phosphate 3-epimerase
VNTVSDRIGFMQGRLSPPVAGKIQAFPARYWREEFLTGQRLGFARLEWTLDQEGLADNPLMTPPGRAEIEGLAHAHDVKVSSVTGDCFMQAPFWKCSGSARARLCATFESVIGASSKAGAKLVVVPLVDNGALTSQAEEEALLEGMQDATALLRKTGVRIAFESDYAPERLASFIARFPLDSFGINLDIGNSASLGWEPHSEIGLLGERIINVHVKDRPFGGATVPLGEGDADLATVFRLLTMQDYRGFLILQTARASDGDHAGVLGRYRLMVLDLAEAA